MASVAATTPPGVEALFHERFGVREPIAYHMRLQPAPAVPYLTGEQETGRSQS